MKKTHNSIFSRVVRAVFFGVGGAAGSRVFMALATLLLSNVLGQETFGRFSTVNDTVHMFVNFAGVWVSASLTRYIAANRADKALQGIYIRTLSRMCMVMAAVLSGILLLFAPQISLLCAKTLELTGYFRLVAAAVFFASMSAVEQSIMVGFERFAVSSSVQLIRCILYCGLGWLFARLWGIYGAVSALVITHGAQYFISFVSNRLYIRKQGIPLRWQWDCVTRQAVTGFALPTFLAALFVLPVNWIGNSILIRSAGFAQVAVFSVARQWMSYITYIPSQLGQMRPIYTDLYARGEGKQLGKLMLRTISITAAAAAVLGSLVVVFSRSILGAYGDGYVQGQYTLIFMMVAAVLYTAQVQTGFLLQAADKMWLGMAVNALWSFCLLGSFACLRGFADLGYAISYAVSYGILLVLQGVISLRELKKLRGNHHV